MDLNTEIQYVPKVGPVMQKKLAVLGIKTTADMLFYLPISYQNFANIMAISKVKLNQDCSVCGHILEIKTSRTWQKKMYITEAIIEDETSAIRAVWFNQPFLTKNLKKGDNLCLAGKVSLTKEGFCFSGPVYEKIELGEFDPIHTGRIVPIYPQTKGLSSRWLRQVIQYLLEHFQGQLKEFLPEQILKEHNLMPVGEALRQAHFPTSLSLAEKAKHRFAFEQLFLIQLLVLQQRIKMAKEKSPVVKMDTLLMQKFVQKLGFTLTDAQRKCVYQILQDLEKNFPMSRLLEGDVGSGKTVVAVMAILNTIKAGFQVALMAPTEILAKQHFNEVAKLLQPFKIKIALLTGKEDQIISQKLGHQTADGFKPEVLEISRSKILEKAKKNQLDLLIGTHSLIQDKVKFANLALAVIDEQHRFGIKQRANLTTKKPGQGLLLPHLLSMTATPIPRTLALTVYGDLDLSIIDQMPKGRKEIITEVVTPTERPRIYNFIEKEVAKGRQVFVICPRIEEAENTNENPQAIGGRSWNEVKAVKTEYEKLSKEIFPKLKVAMLHGKMKVKEKEKIMINFKNKKSHILVATSVIEVGIDVPNATVMLIEGAERFGLAQLHQFRGRVGRAKFQSYCFLFSDSPSANTKKRLKAILKAKNGFELAEHDLAIRGPGSLTGAKQWGMPDLAMEMLHNLPLVEKTRETAKKVLRESPGLKKYPLLSARVSQLSQKIHFE